MKFVAAVIAALFASVAPASANVTGPPSEEEIAFLFSDWMKENDRVYTRSDLRVRFAIFKANVEMIYEHNAANEHSFTLGINQFADLTSQEHASIFSGTRASKRHGLQMADLSDVEVAANIDWREKGGVTAVKNQGQCGSCWAFSAVGSMEGSHFISTGELIDLAPQQFVDCSHEEDSQGCNGGIMDGAFEHAIADGADALKDYNYAGKDGSCREANITAVAKFTAFKDVPKKDEEALAAALNVGPVSIAIKANGIFFQFYDKGIFDHDTCTGEDKDLDHGVLLIGYGTENNTDFWTVKNSWGEGWGESGYIRFAKGKNMCGVASSASYIQ